MSSWAQRICLLSVLLSCGCQSLETLVPWQSASTPNYTAEELAALDSKPVAAARASNQPSTTAETTEEDGGIVQASYSPDATAAPVAAQRIEQFVRSGQSIIASGSKDPNKLAEARSYFEQALQLDQRNSAAHHGTAIVADLQHDYPTAEFHYKQALSANPSDPNLLNDLGYSYVLQNRFAEATNYLNRVLQVAPQHERAKVNLALMSLKRGNRAEAQQILGSVYNPTDAQATMAKLEQSLQTMPVANAPAQMQQNQMQPWQMQTPQTAMNPQHGILQPTENAAAQDVLRRMQEERERAAAVPQPQFSNPPATAHNDKPVHIYPPGIAEQIAAESTQSQQNATAPNMGGLTGNYGQPAQQNQQPQWANNGGIPGFPQSIEQPVGQPAAIGSYPNVATNTNPYGNQQFPNQIPQAQYPQSQPQGMVQQFANGMQQNYPNPMPPQQFPNGQNVAPSAQPNALGAYNAQTPGIGLPATPQNAPLAGLNAGPGALFPIGGPQQQQPGMYQPPVQNGRGYQQPAYQNNGAYGPYPNGNTSQQMPTNTRNATGNNQHPQMARTSQYQNNTSPVSQSQQLNQNWQTQPYQNVQPQFNQPQMGGQYQSAPMPTTDPLEAYERQLQSLDNQYNQAVQQMDGSGLGMSSTPSAQY